MNIGIERTVYGNFFPCNVSTQLEMGPTENNIHTLHLEYTSTYTQVDSTNPQRPELSEAFLLLYYRQPRTWDMPFW
jgi:hypothetical protein